MIHRSTVRTLARSLAALTVAATATLVAPAATASAGDICARTGGPPISTFGPDLVAVGQSAGRKEIAYYLKDHTDVILIIVDDAPDLTHDQMRLEIDIDPVGVSGHRGVTWSKAMEARAFCHGSVAAALGAALRPGADVGRDCRPIALPDLRSGCTVTTTPTVVNRSQMSELWLRKPGFLGVWTDAEELDSSIWNAFAGRSVRFLWRAD